MPKRSIYVKNYERFKNGKLERVREHEREIDVATLSAELLRDVREGKSIKLEIEGDVGKFWNNLDSQEKFEYIEDKYDYFSQARIEELSHLDYGDFVQQISEENKITNRDFVQCINNGKAKWEERWNNDETYEAEGEGPDYDIDEAIVEAAKKYSEEFPGDYDRDHMQFYFADRYDLFDEEELEEIERLETEEED